MKTNHWTKTIGVLLLSLGLFKPASGFAQTLSLQSGSAIDVAQPDSIVQLTADAQGLALVPSDALPDSGTFWLVMPGINAAPMPCPPKDTSLPIYQIANGQFLVDATGGQVAANPQFTGRRMTASEATDALAQQASAVVNLIDQVQQAQLAQATGISMDDSSGMSPDGLSSMIIGTNLWIAQVSVLAGNLNGTATNTQADIQYDIMSRTNLLQSDWQYEGSILGSETTNWTPLTVSQNGRPVLFLRLRSDADDGSGLPIWWQLQYFGYVGVNPNALDSAGDGWSNWQKFQMGLNPNVFYTPPAPQGVTAAYNAANGTALVRWLPSPGPVIGYTITDVNGNSTNVSANAASVIASASNLTPYDPLFAGPNVYQGYSVQAEYAGGNSSWSDTAWLEYSAGTAPLNLVPAAQGSACLVIATSALAPGTTAIRLTRMDQWAAYYYGLNISTNFDIPLSAFTNGVYTIPSAWLVHPVDAYGRASCNWWGATLNAYGSPNSEAIQLTSGFNLNNTNAWVVPPYFDGRTQMKQNLVFQLRSARVDTPFQFGEFYPSYTVSVNFPADYAFAGYYQYDNNNNAVLNALQPFVDNYTYRNFVFNASDLSTSGLLKSVTNYLSTFNFGLTEPPPYNFQLPTTATNQTPILSLLDTNSTRWLGNGLTCYVIYYQYYPGDYGISSDNYWEIAMELNYGTYIMTMGSNVTNLYGLPFLSTAIANGNAASQIYTIYPGNNSTNVFPNLGWMYSEVAQPRFQTVEYDFWNPNAGYWDISWNWHQTEFLPGQNDFSPTNASQQQFFAGVGSQTQIAGYAKLALLNGYDGVYGYLGQYFDQAYQINTNGIVTTNKTGILSPFGNFFATQPGQAALVTMPDIDTGQRGTCTVSCVSLQLNRRHNGNMDLSFNGLDATSFSSPYVFWANQNFDRLYHDTDDNTNYEDDVKIACNPGTSISEPDCNYSNVLANGYAYRAIPTKRDLEDFTRLWICGITTNLLAALPSGSTITLNWGDVGNPYSGNPTIDLFTAADADGGIGYLTNETTAAVQTNIFQCPYIGRLGPGDSIQLNTIQFANSWAGNHFIWCGVSNGMGGLNLTITDGNGSVLAQSTVYIQIADIKQMYERWTVGDNPTNAPVSTPSLVTDELAPSVSEFQYSVPTDTNTPYILFVHGWNMEPWEKDRFAETAFKRLYWQGYHGRFGEFRWPTDYGFAGKLWQMVTNNAEKDNFDNSEYQAWQSAPGLLNLLTGLNAEYPGHVYMLAHSMGNVVAGEALRLAGNSQVVNTYVASQAAVSAHTYDSNTNDVPNYSFYYPPWSSSADTPNIYGNWFANNNGGGAGHVINFYNINDYALQRSAWQRDELLKPDLYVLENGIHWDYGYDGDVSDPPPWNNFFKQGSSTNATVDFNIVNNLNNRYEVMAYDAQSWTTALGATPGVHNVAKSVDLTSQDNGIWPTDPTGNNYTEHFWHSAEFRGDNELMQGYWSELLSSEAFGLK